MKKEIAFDKQELQLIAFKLGEEEYTVPIEAVQEIIMPQKTTHMPKSPSFIEGVINLRGHIIPIIDGRKRFEMPVVENSSETRIIVLEMESHTIGLVVDSVSEVIYLKSSNIEAPPMEFRDNDFIIGVGKYKERLLILLDPQNFLVGNEAESMASTMKITNNISEIANKI